MRIPKRFTLSTLLVVMLVVASVFGYAQWRRLWLKSEVEASENALSQSSLKLRFHDDWFWPTISQESYIDIEKSDAGTFIADGRTLTPSEAKQFLMAKADRLHAMGAKHFRFRVFTTDAPFSKNMFVLQSSVIRNPDDLKLE